MAYKGKFKPKNPDKYAGDPTQIIFRSLWERRFMIFCDTNESVISWASEEVSIPYRDPVTGKRRRYYPDFIVRYRNTSGLIETRIIEVKPEKQCKPPVKPKRNSRSYIREVMNWGTNSAKWKAAKAYAEAKGWKFQLMTEKELDLKND
jgi:hypothetical protein